MLPVYSLNWNLRLRKERKERKVHTQKETKERAEKHERQRQVSRAGGEIAKEGVLGCQEIMKNRRKSCMKRGNFKKILLPIPAPQ